jgi:hypothetical protein
MAPLGAPSAGQFSPEERMVVVGELVAREPPAEMLGTARRTFRLLRV